MAAEQDDVVGVRRQRCLPGRDGSAPRRRYRVDVVADLRPS